VIFPVQACEDDLTAAPVTVQALKDAHVPIKKGDSQPLGSRFETIRTSSSSRLMPLPKPLYAFMG
jgi:hypothetical protein